MSSALKCSLRICSATASEMDFPKLFSCWACSWRSWGIFPQDICTSRFPFSSSPVERRICFQQWAQLHRYATKMELITSHSNTAPLSSSPKDNSMYAKPPIATRQTNGMARRTRSHSPNTQEPSRQSNVLVSSVWLFTRALTVIITSSPRVDSAVIPAATIIRGRLMGISVYTRFTKIPSNSHTRG